MFIKGLKYQNQNIENLMNSIPTLIKLLDYTYQINGIVDRIKIITIRNVEKNKVCKIYLRVNEESLVYAIQCNVNLNDEFLLSEEYGLEKNQEELLKKFIELL